MIEVSRYILDCPVTPNNTKRVNFIYGPGKRRGNAIRQRSDQ